MSASSSLSYMRKYLRVCPLSQLWAFSTSSRKFTSLESTLHHMMLVSAICAISHVRLLLHLHQTSNL